MSGISPTSGSSSTPTISSVGQSLLTSGTNPNAVTAATVANTSTQSAYRTEFNTLNTQDTQELLYASFLSPEDALNNGNDILQQAATLLGSPGHPGTLQTTAAPTLIDTSVPATNVPSVADILAASDEAAQKTLAAYANAPVGSTILDYQA
jgi:hypothetical protein